jgi:transcriptional antiterminator RfaH
VPETLIAQIKLREHMSLAGESPASAPDVPQAGDSINILEGPFKGLNAVFSHTDGQQRSIVLVRLLNQQTPTSLANTQIKKSA